VREPELPEVKLPEAVGARALEKVEGPRIYLTVNSKGQVLLAPSESYRDGTGELVKTLDNPVVAQMFLQQRADEEQPGAGPNPVGKGAQPPKAVEKKDEPEDTEAQKPLRSTIIFRVDRQTPFEKAYPIWHAAQNVGFTKAQWRALRPGGAGEGQIAVVIPAREDGVPVELLAQGAVKTVRYIVRVLADGTGKIAKITLSEGEGPLSALLPELEPPDEKKPPKPAPAPKPPTELGTDVDALAKQLKGLVTKHKGKTMRVQLEIAGSTLHAEVIKLIDAAAGAGVPEVGLDLIDKRRR
jgi:biopolymer transport protein ExbD